MCVNKVLMLVAGSGFLPHYCNFILEINSGKKERYVIYIQLLLLNYLSPSMFLCKIQKSRKLELIKNGITWNLYQCTYMSKKIFKLLSSWTITQIIWKKKLKLTNFTNTKKIKLHWHVITAMREIQWQAGN